MTNGQLYERVLPVLELFRWVRISVDAGSRDVYRRMHGVDPFHHVTTAVLSLAAKAGRTEVDVGFLVTPDNWRSAGDAVALFANSGVSYLQFRPASLVDWENSSDLTEARAYIESLVASSGLTRATGVCH